ncbi:hypothetical protein HELRODRAFT_186048 [Helobdella robusta]|uniref:RanBD1 domain-containing protein n=1 Tax=Helobdella robusta TaxID=6412 RepID=T1FNL4_HELRO|nr:hypothetical protein HELRODRAFT_186048 [Helobdella robusta]ESN94000.1 hypothetical protein HELRODRAFT_186048 [Helobdella robusta]
MSLDDKEDVVIDNPDPHFEPIVSLAPVQVVTLEEDEEELVKLRAKLFRYDRESEPKEWKERGTGEVKILKHKVDGTCRILMRRDKTFKICANHYITPDLELKPNCGSDRAWCWSTLADFADEQPKSELLAIRFASSENAQKFKDAFDEARSLSVSRVEASKSAVSNKSIGENNNNTSATSEQEDNEDSKVGETGINGDVTNDCLHEADAKEESHDTKQPVDTTQSGDTNQQDDTKEIVDTIETDAGSKTPSDSSANVTQQLELMTVKDK